jgi:tetratricopeptide (TPR) repeat protein
MTTKQSTKTKCIACHESIQSGASVCRYCGFLQKRNIWQTLSTGLKWIGGVVTIVSLLIGMFTLAGYYLDWQERRDAVTELVEAADWLIKTKDYSQAWQMYEEALQLVPSAANVRKGQFQLAKLWLRDFRASKKKIDGLLNRITAILYRGLRGSDKHEIATILSHICWAQILRIENSIPVTIDVDAVFQEALHASQDNIYANAMMGYWILRKRGVVPEDVALAQSKFMVALKTENKKSFVRRLQFAGLIDLSYGKSDELEKIVLAVLLRTSYSMMQAGEPKPADRHRFKILDAYGNMGRADHVEASIKALPPADHLAVHEWLLDGLDYSGRSRMLIQSKYVRARLMESMGDRQPALLQYQSLLEKTQSTNKLYALLKKGITRLGGMLPESFFARNYQNDPVDQQDPWGFHRETLANFQPIYQTSNFKQAVDYFFNALVQSPSNLPELVNFLPENIERVRSVVGEGDKIAQLDGFTSGFNSSHHDNARKSLIQLYFLYVRALTNIGSLDKAIAQLSDMNIFTEKLGNNWKETQAGIYYELARAHALRAKTKHSEKDIAKALKYLKISIDDGAIAAGITNWEEIKSDIFKIIADDPYYKELIRGR